MHMTEHVRLDGSVESAIRQAVTGYQMNHGGMRPSYVYVPRGRLPDELCVKHWAARNVTIVACDEAECYVWAV